MIGPEHSHDLAITLKSQPALAIAAPAGERHSPQRVSSAIALQPPTPRNPTSRSSRRSSAMSQPSVRTVLLSLISASPAAMAACISLEGSTACSAFQSASISTDSFVLGLLYVRILLGPVGVQGRVRRLDVTGTNLSGQSFSSVRVRHRFIRSATAILCRYELCARKVR